MRRAQTSRELLEVKKNKTSRYKKDTSDLRRLKPVSRAPNSQSCEKVLNICQTSILE